MISARKFTHSAVTVLLWLLTLASAIISGYLIYGLLGFYGYRFPQINSWWLFLVDFGSNLIPALLTGASVFFLLKNQKRTVLICLIAFVPMTICGFFTSVSHGLFNPSVSSYTSDPSNFGVYDSRPAEDLKANPPPFFPSVLPENAENVKYCYFYENASAETLYCAVSWETDETELKKIEMQMDQDRIVWIGTNECMIRLTEIYPANAIYIDYENKRVYYVIASSDELLPELTETVINQYCYD